jgi:tetratricopeptide (TPR) repeat protein
MSWQTITDYVAQHAWINQSFRILVVLGVLYAIYRYVMSPRADWLRQKIAPLRFVHSSNEVRDLLKMGEFAQAGEKLLEMGDEEKAIEIFQQGKLYGRAGDIYANRKNLQKAVLLYEKAGDIKKVGEIYLKSRNFDKLEDLFRRNNRLTDLGELYQENKKHQRAAELFARINEFYKAAENYLAIQDEVKTAEMLEQYFYQTWKAESPDMSVDPSKRIIEIALKAGVLFEKNNKWDQAVNIYTKINDRRRMAGALAKKGDYKQAASIAEETGEYKLASDLHKKMDDPKEAARLEGEHLFKNGDLQNAIEKFREAQDYSRCAELYSDLQEYKEAAVMHEQAGEFFLAGKIFLDEKEYLRAGENFEKAQYDDEALEAYRKGKLENKILELMERKGKYLDMADYFYNRKLFEQAVACIERIAPSDPDHRFGLYVRGKIAYEKGNFEQAKLLFEESLQSVEELTERDLNTLHYLALTEQNLGAEAFKALEILETKLAQNQIVKSSLEKANSIRKMIQDKSLAKISQSQILHLTSGGTTGGMTDASGQTIRPSQRGISSSRRYHLIKEIGRGGMGVVYLAKDLSLDREVALKILPTSMKNNQRVIDTFLREAKSAAALNHPNIVTVFDTGVQDGDYYISMEHIDGKTLKRILKKKGKFTYPVVMELLKQLLGALEYAHSRKVVHRDLTTSNIMWTRQKMIKIMDYGLAKVVHNLQSEQSIIGGTPSFMSPEQTLGKPVDHRTDIYSLGICIFEMCMGTLPFSKGDLGYHHLHTPAPIPKEIDPSIPEAINDAILKCMQKKPEDRFQSVQEIIVALSLN